MVGGSGAPMTSCDRNSSTNPSHNRKNEFSKKSIPPPVSHLLCAEGGAEDIRGVAGKKLQSPSFFYWNGGALVEAISWSGAVFPGAIPMRRSNTNIACEIFVACRCNTCGIHGISIIFQLMWINCSDFRGQCLNLQGYNYKEDLGEQYTPFVFMGERHLWIDGMHV